MVVAALGLNLGSCERKNVKLIFSSIDKDERQPRAGFCRGDADIKEISCGERKAITVAVVNGRRSSTLLYEAMHLTDLGGENIRISPYQVFAVWVPIQSIANKECEAQACQFPYDFLKENVGALV